MHINEGVTYNGGIRQDRNQTADSRSVRGDERSERSGLPFRPAYPQGQSGQAGPAEPNRYQESRNRDSSRSARDHRGNQWADALGSTVDSLEYGLPTIPSRPVDGAREAPLRSTFASQRDSVHAVASATAQAGHQVSAAPSTSDANGSVKSQPVRAEGDREAPRVQGILKKPAAMPEAEVLNKSNNGQPTTAWQDPLRGKKVTIRGLVQPIKALAKTLESLRQGKSINEAFESKEGSYLFSKHSNAHDGLDNDVLVDDISKIPYLSVYFPLQRKVESIHNPADCGNLCNGQPHVDRKPICRFCSTSIGPKYRSQVSSKANPTTIIATVQLADGGVRQVIFNARDCLDHLQDCKGIPSEDDRKLLYNAFREADKAFIDHFATSEWKVRLQPVPSTHAPRPALPPRAPAKLGANTQHKKSSSLSNSIGSTREQLPKKTYNPIAAKNVPNHRPASEEASTRNRRTSADSSNSNMGTSAQRNEAGWGVSSRDVSYTQHVTPDVVEEQDELAEPQCDPEDNFTWQNVTPAVPSPQQPTNDLSLPVHRVPLAPQVASTGAYGVEIIRRPDEAPKLPAPIEVEQYSWNKGPLAPNPATEEVTRDTSSYLQNQTDIEAEVRSRVQALDLRAVKALSADMQAMVSNATSSTESNPLQEDVQLFRSATPPGKLARNDSHVKAESASPAIGLPVEQDSTSNGQDQELGEPELPAEDPWDLSPDPRFEPSLAHREDFLRSAAPSLESGAFSRESSGSKSPTPKPEATHTEDIKNEDARPSPPTRARSPSYEIIPTPMDIAASLKPVSAQDLARRVAGELRDARQARKEKTRQTKGESSTEAFTAAETTQGSQEESDNASSEDVPLRQMPSQAHMSDNELDSLFDDVSEKASSSQSIKSQGKRPSGADHTEITSSPPREEAQEDGSSSDSSRKKASSKPDTAKSSKEKGKTLKSDRKGKFKKRSSSAAPSDDDDDDSSDSDSDSDAPFVTSVRAPVAPTARPAAGATGSSKHATTHAAFLERTKRASKKRQRTPTPDSSEHDDPEMEKKPTPKSSQALDASRFQRFSQRDRTPADEDEEDQAGEVEEAEEEDVEVQHKHKKKKRASLPVKKSKRSDHSKPKKAVSSPAAIVRRREPVIEIESSSPVKNGKRKAKRIQASEDEEEQSLLNQAKRLKTYSEKQAELGSSRRTSLANSLASASTSQQVNELGNRSRGASIAPSDSRSLGDAAGRTGVGFTYHPSDFFFVDVDKNQDTTMSLPEELDRWEDIFKTADIYNLETLAETVKGPENAANFVAFLAQQIKHPDLKSIRKQYPLVLAIQRVLGGQ